MTLLRPFSTPDVSLRHPPRDDFGFELIALAGLIRLDNDRHFGELTGTPVCFLCVYLDFGRAW